MNNTARSSGHQVKRFTNSTQSFSTALHLLPKLSMILATLCLLLTALSATAKPAPFERLADQLNPADYNADALLVIHYHRPDGKYDRWNAWAWAEGQNGDGYSFDGETVFGRYAVFPIQTADNTPERVGLIIRRGEWESKDIGMDRYADISNIAKASKSNNMSPLHTQNKAGQVKEIWLVSSDPTIYTDPTDIDLSFKITNAFLDAPDRITLAATGLLDDEIKEDISLQLAPYADQANRTNRYKIKSIEESDVDAAGRVIYDVTLNRRVAAADIASLVLDLPNIDSDDQADLTVYARNVLNDKAFVAPDATLGVTYKKSGSRFTTWSPVASAVHLLFYDNIGDANPSKTIPLKQGKNGIWSTEVKGNLHGQVYRYQFTSYGRERTVVDIHANAASFDSQYAVVVDFNQVNPANWRPDTGPRLANPTDEIIYEIHVRDLTIRDDTLPAAKRGTYLGLIHEHAGESPNYSRGLSHIKDLGVTAVHLLPIHDYTAPVGQYNWGYWTALFNVPEANYSTNPYDPFLTITELKTAILGLHDEDIRVILDVVYNHTSSSGEWSPFEQTVPFYYFRTSADGELQNDTGVGNSVADERPMVRKYIIDSLKFWVNEYNIDGFRFDLIGNHEAETVHELTKALTAIRPDITLYGEPWTGGGPVRYPKGTQRGTRMAVFNDHSRNAIRGDLDGKATGFSTGPGGDVGSIIRGLMGGIDDFATEPIETITYVSAHDNRTLWDKIQYTHPGIDEATAQSMHKLSLGLILTSQGIAFLHGGSDFARTKQLNHNSYDSGDDINLFDWDRKLEYRNVFDYTKGLVAIRNQHAALRMTSADAIRRHTTTHEYDNVVHVHIRNAKSVGDTADELLMLYNGADAERIVDLPDDGRNWTVLVDAEKASAEGLYKLAAGKRVILPPYSMMMFSR